MGILRAACFAYLMIFWVICFGGLWRSTEDDDTVFGIGLGFLAVFIVAAFILYV